MMMETHRTWMDVIVAVKLSLGGPVLEGPSPVLMFVRSNVGMEEIIRHSFAMMGML